MKTLLYTLVLALSGLFISGCDDDFLERPSKDHVEAKLFFNTAIDLEIATNDFYTMLPTTDVYSDDAASDNLLSFVIAERVRGTRIVPSIKGTGGWSWDRLRSINFFLENYHRCPDPDARAKYSGIAKFFRAFFYFDKVRRFGDVPWYGKVLQADDGDLYKARDSRELVMDSVLADIDYAVANIPAEVELNRITKYTALILKARICLFEGTFRKYHNLGNHEKFLTEAVQASEALISSGVYTLFTDGGPDVAYRRLFGRNNQEPSEVILARDYEQDLEKHNLGYPIAYTWGLPKDLVNSYLMKDGTRFTDQPQYETIGFYQEMQNRDPRLTQTTAGPGFVVNGQSTPEPVNVESVSGYRLIKALPSKDQWASFSAYFDIVIFRYAEALLAYAEAKAELGTITQADLDISINKLRDRVGMPDLELSTANMNPDAYLENMYPNIDQGPNKGVLLEIRRERRIEMFNEGLRWDDLMRWKEGRKVEPPMLGIYFSGLGSYDFDNDGDADVYVHDGDRSGAPPSVTSFVDITKRALTNGTAGYLNPFPSGGSFDENKDYYYPIPIEDLQLNKNLEQNPGW